MALASVGDIQSLLTQLQAQNAESFRVLAAQQYEAMVKLIEKTSVPAAATSFVDARGVGTSSNFRGERSFHRMERQVRCFLEVFLSRIAGLAYVGYHHGQEDHRRDAQDAVP